MAYTRSWDETQPVDHLELNKVPFWDRAIRVDIAERLKNFFYGFIVGENEVGAKKIEFVKQSTSPNAVTNKGIIFTKEVDGEVELFYKSASGKEKQITKKGDLNFVAFESGDILLTTKDTTPEGWEDLSATYDNRFIRISSGTPLETGGSDTHNHGGSTEPHTLTIDEIPPHTHSGYFATWLEDSSGDDTDYYVNKYHTLSESGSTGGGQPHSHGISEASNIPAYIQVRMLRKL